MFTFGLRSRLSLCCRRRGLLLAVALAVNGCTLMQLGQRGAGPDGEGSADQVRSAMLPPIPTSPGAVELEIVFIERPLKDPLLGTRLWDEIDTGAALDFQRREVLDNNGMIVGVSPANPPGALRKLLGLDRELSDSPINRLFADRRVLPDGAEAEIQASEVHPECSVTLLSATGAEERPYKNARFLFRVMTRRVQHGWVQVDFLPEIHHGEMTMRPEAAEVGYTMRASQKVEPLFGQRFSIKLNVGEMAVMTCDSDDPKSVGRHFFVRTNDDGVEVKRLLVVRLADMAKTDPVFAR